MVSDSGQIIRCPIDKVSTVGRSSRGVTIFKTAEGEQVVSVSRLRDVNGNGDGNDNGGEEAEEEGADAAADAAGAPEAAPEDAAPEAAREDEAPADSPADSGIEGDAT